MHAVQFGSTSWLPLLPTLAAAHRVTMIDAIGDVNKSIATKPVTTPAHVVTWLDETLHALRIDQAAVVGMSMGTWRSAHFAMAFPNRIDRLALICPVGLVIDSTATQAGRQRLRQDPWRPIVEQYVMGTIGFHFPLIAARPMRCDLQQLASARIPTLAMIGRNETLHDGPKAAARYRRQLPDARVVLVDNANHLIPVDQPAVVDRLLTDFLNPP